MSRINYDLTKIRGIAFDVDGVLSPSTIPLSSSGEPLRMVNIKDGYALQLAVRSGLNIIIITGADSRGIIVRYTGLGITDVCTQVSKKVPLLVDWMDRCGLLPAEVAYVGDDIPDYEAMRLAGLKVAPRDAADDIKEIADYIAPVDGGYGVARDLLEQILRAQGKWMNDEKAFGW